MVVLMVMMVMMVVVLTGVDDYAMWCIKLCRGHGK